VPTGHCVHAELPLETVAYVPAGQLTHVAALDAACITEYVPEGHATHDTLPSSEEEYVPAGQGVHVASLVAPA
jgi:hypothetical protein